MSASDQRSSPFVSDSFVPAPRRAPAVNNAVDIPSAALQNSMYIHQLSNSSPSAADASGIFTASSGASPAGHGVGHLMRPRRRISRQYSRENHAGLHSHDELSELLSAAEAPEDPADPSPEPSPSLNWALSSYGTNYGVLSQDELAAPLLPFSSCKPGSAPVLGEHPPTPLLKAVVFGCINAIAGIPALVAYAAIVFKHPIYEPYLDLLCKFFFISSAMHQAVFCLMSALPYAMGQVQDVGIIFLSAIGTSVAMLCEEAGKDAATALGTALLTMTLSTFCVGLGTLFVARKHLATFVQYLPLPVMGGYLGFVGYFCIASGMGLGTSTEITTLMSWRNLCHKAQLLKFIPTVASTAIMILSLERFEHPLVLPGVLIAIVLSFHAVLLWAGLTLKDAQNAGWVLKPAAGGAIKFWELWKLYNFKDFSFSGIYPAAMVRQLAKAAGLMLVVVFGSCMDIAAIQQDIPTKIDFDRELTTVAVSNMATGLAGVGFTGSYIFSQTIFTMRAGVFHRANGWVIAAAEAATFLLPYSVVQYLPNFFLGALLVWFGVEITRDWLILSYYRLTAVEYGLLWLTFGSVMQWGLEGGIASGIVCATLYFAYAYARSQVGSFGAAVSRSTVVRTVEQQAALDLFWGSHAATAQLQGFVFFGSAQSIAKKLEDAAERLSAPAGAGADAQEAAQQRAALEQCLHSMGEAYAGAKHGQALNALEVAPRFFIMDFSKVSGIDTSGARTLVDVARQLLQRGIAPVLTGADRHGIFKLLGAHQLRLKHTRWPPELRPAEVATVQTLGSAEGSPGDGLQWPSSLIHATGAASDAGSAAELDNVLWFPTLEEGLRFCEDALLEVAVRFGLCRLPNAGVTLEELLSAHLEKLPLTASSNAPAMAATLRRYMQRRTVGRGEALWKLEDAADAFFVVEKGTVRVDQYKPAEEAAAGEGSVRLRSFELGPGCVAGTTDFYLARPHGTQAVCASHACRVLWLSKEAMQRMAVEAPAALNVLQLVVMRANTSDLSAAADAAARAQ